MSTAESGYVAGVCNINIEEIARRRKAGHFGVILFVIVLAALLVLDINRYVRIILFVPAFIAAIGYLQAHNHFCVGYAAAGQQNADEGSTKVCAVKDATAHKKDTRRAHSMNMQAIGIALLVTVISLLIPHL